MKWIPAFGLFLVMVGCSSTPTKNQTEATSGETKSARAPFKVNRYEFGNGLRLVVVEDHSSPTFAYQTWFRVGSRNEVPGRTGLAHLFEHMMFKGTKKYSDGEFDRILERSGAEGENAFTSRDYTAYIQELPSTDEKLDMIASLEADRMVNLVINEKGFKTEREVVQNERRFRNENSPDGLMDQELFSLAFTKHPYHWPIIGYQKDLAEMSDSDAFRFYQSYYSPNHATIIAVGDLDPEKVKKTVEKYYGRLQPQPAPEMKISHDLPQKSLRKKKLHLNIQVEKLLLGYHVPEFDHADMPVLEVIRGLLTGGKSSRLNQALVETGIASAVESADLENMDPSLLMVSVNLQKGKKASQAEAIILKEMARLQTLLVSEDELERAKNKIRFEFYSNLGSSFEKAYFLGHYESIGGSYEKGFDTHEKAQTVTAEQVRAVAKRYLNSKNLSIIEGVPK